MTKTSMMMTKQPSVTKVRFQKTATSAASSVKSLSVKSVSTIDEKRNPCFISGTKEDAVFKKAQEIIKSMN